MLSNSTVVQIPLPRKGTETLKANCVRHFFKSSNSITPQGDGNSNPIPFVNSLPVQIPLPRKGTETISPWILNSAVQKFKFHYPARGRKQAGQSLARESVRVQIPLPRKGTETIASCILKRCASWFKFHYPARGRKPLNVSVFGVALNSVQIPLPRKDGNYQSRSKNLPVHPVEFKFHYPARGRKPRPVAD